MSKNVRRLVLDFSPIVQNAIGLILWVVIGFLSALWMAGKGSPNIMMVFSASIATMTYTIKTPIWRTLPVSSAELGRTQWWYAFGRPLLFAIATFALAIVTVASGGWLKVAPRDLLAFGCSELCLMTLMGLAPLLSTGLAASMGAVGFALGIGPPLAAAFGLGLRWTDKDGFTAHGPEMFPAGACAAAVLLVIWVLAPWLPLASQRPARQKKERGARAKIKVAPRYNTSDVNSTSAIGWGALAAVFTSMALRIFVPLCALVVLAVVSVQQRVLGTSLPFSPVWGLQLLPLFVYFSLAAVTWILPQRVLGGLPQTAEQRALAIQLIAPALLVPAGLATAGLAWLLDREAVNIAWLVICSLQVLGGIALAALSLPLRMRFGQIGSVLAGVVFALPMGFIGALLPTSARGAQQLFGVDIHLVIAILSVSLFLLLVGSWIWTWLELKYGRAAYRQITSPLIGLRWRGS